MLEETRKYLSEHRDEVLREVAAKRNIERAFLDWVFRTHDLAAGPVTAEEAARITATWEAARAIGDIPSYPKIDDVLFKR